MVSCLLCSLEPESTGERGDAALAAALSEDRRSVNFERFNPDDVLVENRNVVAEINAFCRERREKYVDPQFPPINRSLYVNELDASTWCCTCQARNPMPPKPDLPKSKEEAQKIEDDFQANVRCGSCGQGAPMVVLVRHINGPEQWLRPGVACDGCTMLWSHVPQGKELVSRMCTHFLRDGLTGNTVGAEWKLIRGEARAEDVCQGGLGNCWFAGALTVVAQKPSMIKNLFLTREYNAYGVYQVQLCHMGEWRPILIDDLLPTTKTFEGYMDGKMVYYSRGGELCYLQGARRSLWPNLVEKAAAKLFGSYGALTGGTFGEALTLFTGFSTERCLIRVHSETLKRRQRRQEYRTQLLLQGQAVPDFMESSDEEVEDVDLIWTRLVSANQAGFLMGLGCTAEGCEKTKDQILEAGLQAPHAYGVLDVREVDVGGRIERLVKVRNPWGERAPRTWKGDWGKDSKKWTFALKRELGVVTPAGVAMDDEMSVFWMSFGDLRNYFSAVEICRVHSGWHETRARAWLPSGVGPGEAFNLTVYRKTQVDVALWQEKHITREAAL